jgi:excisionase family DNA binding protein
MAPSDDLFLPEAAAHARVSVTTLRRLIATRAIRARKKAGKWRVKRGEIDRWLETSDEGQRTSAAVPARAHSKTAPTAPLSTAYPWEKA